MADNNDSRLDDNVAGEEELVDLGVAPESSDEERRKGYQDYVNQSTQQDDDAQEQQEEEEEDDDDIPDKYRGKSVKDIVAMHQNAEKLLGKQSSEVGELRRVVDDFIQSQTIAKQETAPSATEDSDDLDFFENPKAAVAKMLENHPSVKQSQQVTQRLAQQEAVAKLKSDHPDYTSIVQDQKFIDWVSKSKIRTDLLRRADAYDYESANELFSLWKERQGVINETMKNETKARKESVKKGSTGNVKGSGERASRRVYSRADVVELMIKDPERYQALASDIRQAYAEGRVK